MVAPWIIPAAASLFGLFGSTQKSSPTTVTQEPLWTPEQKEAMDMILNYGKTGKWGSFTAGDTYSGSLGDFSMTAPEMQGQSLLTSLLNAGTPDTLTASNKEVMSLLGSDKYDPYNEKGVYGGFKANVMKELEEGKQRIKRERAASNRLYSSQTDKQLMDVEGAAMNTLTQKLAELYDTNAARKIQAIPMGAALAQTGQALDMNKLSAVSAYGSLPRLLATAEAQSKYSEWLRGRKEFGDTIGAVQSVATNQVPWGQKSMTVPGGYEETPWTSLLNAGLASLGTYFGKK